MKTIAFRDLTGGPMREFVSRQQNDLFARENSRQRIENALRELKHVGNIAVYLVRGRKVRRISIHRM